MIEGPNPKPSVLRVSNRRNPAVFAANGLGAAVEKTDIAVFGPGSHHAFQRELGKFIKMKIRKSGHGVCILTEVPAPFNLP
jgi:hypothetical protein